MKFQPGQSGNPRGRPRKHHSVTEALEKYVNTKDKLSGKQRREVLAAELWRIATRGEDDKAKLQAIKYIYDRIDGRPRESVELTGADMAAKLREVLDEV
jgi:hypothetical protein